MKNDQIVFEKTRTIAHDIDQMQNQQEKIDYLFRQDSLTLNQLKQYYSEPFLPLHFLVKVAVLCMFISMALASFFFIQAKEVFINPILSNISPAVFSIFTVICMFMTYTNVIKRGYKNKGEASLIQQSEFYEKNKLINTILYKKYKVDQQNIQANEPTASDKEDSMNFHAVLNHVLTISKNDKELLAYLDTKDIAVLNQLKAYFSARPFSLSHYMSLMFCGSIIVIYATTLFSGQINYIDIPDMFIYLLFTIFLKILIDLIKLLNISRKGQLHTVLHFVQRAEYLRMKGVIDFILTERYNKKIL
ncbi:hypothetical protein [Bacillus vallismortis]|uniref:Uncharacterized protein n=1 Tax=Bacillus vallismortis TaxID=72361 RepID=A0AAP3CHG3_BACVA|nr:hypothetical protein [Bacillus vallismortis]MCY7917407.1 hypothetical protein [Bacillus vallismortis]MCY8309835.1 hypothetical protein [Bacillus vallismortis]MCY8316321.1 hypothetical protein [Bacillus vallismortis]MCY8597549.1 hypothetical protein [Bacillus vallismortis]